MNATTATADRPISAVHAAALAGPLFEGASRHEDVLADWFDDEPLFTGARPHDSVLAEWDDPRTSALAAEQRWGQTA